MKFLICVIMFHLTHLVISLNFSLEIVPRRLSLTGVLTENLLGKIQTPSSDTSSVGVLTAPLLDCKFRKGTGCFCSNKCVTQCQALGLLGEQRRSSFHLHGSQGREVKERHERRTEQGPALLRGSFHYRLCVKEEPGY